MKLSFSDKFFALLKSESVSTTLEKFKKDKKILFIILIGIAGMFLIMLAPSDKKTEEYEAKSDTCDYYSLEEIENELESLIESIKGAGEARVFITYESDRESVYAMNTDEKTDGSEVHFKNEYIITDEEKGLILKVLYPKVRGVAVICKGGNDPVVKEKIYSVISALFDISTKKISVADMV